jgi:hypothetical protein
MDSSGAPTPARRTTIRVSVLDFSPVFDSQTIFPLVGSLAVELPASRKLPIAVPEDFERSLAASVAIDYKIARTRNRNLDLIALFELERLYYGLR